MLVRAKFNFLTVHTEFKIAIDATSNLLSSSGLFLFTSLANKVFLIEKFLSGFFVESTVNVLAASEIVALWTVLIVGLILTTLLAVITFIMQLWLWLTTQAQIMCPRQRIWYIFNHLACFMFLITEISSLSQLLLYFLPFS